MNTIHLAAWLLAAMNSFVSQSDHSQYESHDVTEERYQRFADDVAFAVAQPYVKPIFEGANGRAQTGLLFVSLASFESQFRADVVSCADISKRTSEQGNGDHGHSWSWFQTSRNKKLTCSSTLGALVVGLEMVHESFNVCRGLKLTHRLAEYTDGGNFLTERAAKRSEYRIGRAMRYWAKHPYIESEDTNELLSAR